jgi:hypothetical protein
MLTAARQFLRSTSASSDSPSPQAGPYLRRPRLARPRGKRHRILLLGLAVVTGLLFTKVWQVTAAHSLSAERDELRHEVRALENRIHLSSELAVRAALKEGLDYQALAGQGFQSPDPSAIVDIDLANPVPSLRPRGATARLSASVGRLLRGLLPGAPRDREARVNVAAVNAVIPGPVARDEQPAEGR